MYFQQETFWCTVTSVLGHFGPQSLRSFFQGPKYFGYVGPSEVTEGELYERNWNMIDDVAHTLCFILNVILYAFMTEKRKSQLTIIYFVKRKGLQNVVQDGVMRDATWSQFSLTFNNNNNNNNNNTKFIR